MERNSLYEKYYQVTMNHVDFKGNLKLSSLFTYFQDIAGLHSERLSMGMETLYRNYNALWVLARVRVDVARYPLLDEKILVKTWPQSPGRIEFPRDYIVEDQQGNVLAKAISSWVLIDIKTRRLKKPKDIMAEYPPIIKERAINCKLGSLNSKGSLELFYKKRVGYSDIDMNKHLNNSKYIDFIMDSFDLEDHEKYHIKSIEVNYSKEALPGDTIAIYQDLSQVSSGLIYMEGINEENNSLTFKSKVKIEAK